MRDGEINFTFAVVVRGGLKDINLLMDFLKESDLVIAHHEIGHEKMWIKKGEGHDR